MKVIDDLVLRLKQASMYNANKQVAPVAVLWTDKESQWLPVIQMIQARVPELLVLGDYDVEQRKGPAIWIKCMVARLLREANWDENATPIIYLPGVGRSELRAIESCPKLLQPLAELQYRGVLWSQVNGKDWTVNAYLFSKSGGLGLDVSRDKATQESLLRALGEVLDRDISELSGKRLEASDFNQLLAGDTIRDLLIWMNDSEQAKAHWSQARWRAFTGLCQSEFQFDPDQDGALTAAERLCVRAGKWQQVWDRYAVSFTVYPQMLGLLERVQAPDLFASVSNYPVLNKKQEDDVKDQFESLLDKIPTDARKLLLQLEKKHAIRRELLWMKAGRAPLAMLLEPLAIIADKTQSGFGGLTAEEMVEHYTSEYWQVDDAMLQALGMAKGTPYQSLVKEILAITYTPWLADITHTFQKLIKDRGGIGKSHVCEATKPFPMGGEVVFFVDGLRFDVANRLVKRLSQGGSATVQLTQHLAALPTVTATGKAAVTPIFEQITGRATDKDFQPSLASENKPFSAHYFKKLMGESDWQVLSASEVGDISGRAWVECGDIDKEGHVKGLKLAGRIDALLDEIIERIHELLDAGWHTIRIVTDHGWLLVPGGLPKSHLPKTATESRWGRCAELKRDITVDELTLGWHWNQQVAIAYAPGIASFIAGKEYDHGGISLQECVTPVITIKANHAEETIHQGTIDRIAWRGFICKLEVSCDGEGIMADLRHKPADANSSLVRKKAVKNGKCTLMVEDDDREGESAVVVLLDDAGELLAMQPTIVGGA